MADGNRRLLQGIVGLSLAGLVVSSYLSRLDLLVSRFPNKNFCSISQLFSCDVVLRSSYAHIFGVPVAVLGQAGFLLFLGLGVWALAARGGASARGPILGLVVFSGLALLFECYLTALEAFVIKTFCPYCLTVFALIVVIFGLSVRAASRAPRPGAAALEH